LALVIAPLAMLFALTDVAPILSPVIAPVAMLFAPIALIVAIDGVLQSPTTYSVIPSSNTITFLTTPSNGEYISVTTLSNAANVYVIDDGSITFNKLQSTVNNKIDLALNQANAGFATANSAGIYANGAFVTANAAATTGKAIAMSIVFGG